MVSSPPPISSAAKQVQPSESSALPWVSSGVEAGVAGAAVVALFFLGADWLAGRPLWTPHALGSSLFLGVRPDPGATPEALMVLAYTAVHGVVFIGFGVPAAFQVLARASAMRRPASALLVGALLFVGFELVFLALGELFLAGMISTLGVLRVTAANALAAAVMAGFLWARARREA
jgi:hypothetical protein